MFNLKSNWLHMLVTFNTCVGNRTRHLRLQVVASTQYFCSPSAGFQIIVTYSKDNKEPGTWFNSVIKRDFRTIGHLLFSNVIWNNFREPFGFVQRRIKALNVIWWKEINLVLASYIIFQNIFQELFGHIWNTRGSFFINSVHLI